MSAISRTLRARLLWISPGVVLASWLTVRTLAASPETARPAVPAAMSPTPSLATSSADQTTEIKDQGLAQMIGRFASTARAASH